MAMIAVIFSIFKAQSPRHCISDLIPLSPCFFCYLWFGINGTLLCETSNHSLPHSCSRLWWHLVQWSCSTWPNIQKQIPLNFHSLINNPLLHGMLPQGSMLMHYTFICHWDDAPKHRCVINVMPLVKSNGLSSTWSITS